MQCSLEKLQPDTSKLQSEEKRAQWKVQVAELHSSIEHTLCGMSVLTGPVVEQTVRLQR